MGKTGYGVFATVWVWILVLGHVSLLGLAQTICRFVPAYRVTGEPELARGFLAFGAMTTLLGSALLAGTGGLLLWRAQALIDPAYVAPAAMALLVLPVFALQDYVEGVARSFNWAALAIVPPFIIRQGLLALAMAAAVAFGAPADPWVAVACTLLATSAATAIQTAVLTARIRRALRSGSRAYRIKEWSAATLPIAFIDLTLLGLGFVDVLLLGLFVPAGEVGVYFAATRVAQIVIFAQYAATAATAQRFAEAWARNDHATLRALIRRTALLTCLATIGLGGALLLASPLLLAMFGPGFSASFNALAILVLGTAVQSAFGPAEDLLNMLGEARRCALVSFAALVAAVLLNLLLIPKFGVIGAATAVAMATAGRALALSVFARVRLGLRTDVFA